MKWLKKRKIKKQKEYDIKFAKNVEKIRKTIESE